MHPVVVITAASGGLGVSTLSAVTATVLARDGSPTLVDAGFGGGGLDATVAVEHLDGLRWGDLADHDGSVDAAQLRGSLPQGPVPVLAARGPRPAPSAVVEVVSALAGVGPVVVDLPCSGRVPPVWAQLADVVVVLVGLRPRWLRDGQAWVEGVADSRTSALLVTRGPRRAERVSERAADHLGLSLLAHLADDAGVLRDEAQGRAPRPRGAVGDLARALASSLPPSLPSSIGPTAAVTLSERVLGVAS